MSREPIPAFDCRECDKYDECKSLCAAGKLYADQDKKKQKEITIGLPRIANRNWDTESLQEKIIYLNFVRKLSQIEIGIKLNCSQPYVSKVIRRHIVLLNRKNI